MKLLNKVTATAALLVLICLCGCTSLVERFYPDDTTDPAHTAFVPVDVSDGSVYFRDFDGNIITLEKAPEKIASLSEVSTDILVGLGAGRYISAVNEGSLKIEGAPISAAVVPDYYCDTAKLTELKPELVFYSDSSLSYIAVTALKSAGLTLVRIPEKGNILTAESNIRFISSLMYKESNGERMIDEMRSEYEKMKVLAELVGMNRRVYIENVGMYSACGGDCVISELCGFAGAENVFAGSKGSHLTNPEELKKLDPDVIIVLSKDPESFQIDSVRKREGLEDVYAVRTKAIYAIDYTAATLPTQSIIKALRSVGAALKVTK